MVGFWHLILFASWGLRPSRVLHVAEMMSSTQWRIGYVFPVFIFWLCLPLSSQTAARLFSESGDSSTTSALGGALRELCHKSAITALSLPQWFHEVRFCPKLTVGMPFRMRQQKGGVCHNKPSTGAGEGPEPTAVANSTMVLDHTYSPWLAQIHVVGGWD